ncbi:MULTISPECIES: carbamate kinase [unclassified Thioalkalivibrio]|uniref:carbamate kinase n=1 Tax=unclassified Thioalkalivibrio TaxID=2621013 RepID=UPI00036326CE|nr:MULTISPECIES: carbamate kinase [unclassified Thioalkalivibrio]
MRIVIALGGNALLQRGETPSAEAQQHNAQRAAAAIAAVAREHEVVVTHGNGPQVGLLANQAECDRIAWPLDVVGAESHGMIGYILARELHNALGHDRVASLLTQTEVDPNDPAFDHPEKFIGPTWDAARARALADERGWHVAPDGEGWRRVVASPEPQRLLGMEAVRSLVDGGSVAICAGGGGVPVARDGDGRLHGIEAVVDKDLTAARLAAHVGADRLLMLTDVDGVYMDWGTPDARRLKALLVTAVEPAAYPGGSMGPKMEAARRAAQGGIRVGIGSLEDAAAILAGQAGTRILPVGAA